MERKYMLTAQGKVGLQLSRIPGAFEKVPQRDTVCPWALAMHRWLNAYTRLSVRIVGPAGEENKVPLRPCPEHQQASRGTSWGKCSHMPDYDQARYELPCTHPHWIYKDYGYNPVNSDVKRSPEPTLLEQPLLTGWYVSNPLYAIDCITRELI